MNRIFPGIIIDRSRQSPYAEKIYDFIVCTDETTGFIARACKINKTQFEAYEQKIASLNKDEAECKFITQKLNNNIAVVIEVIKITHPPVTDRTKMKSLLRKVMKQYLESEAEIIAGDGTDIDQQIAVVEEMERIAKSQYDNLVLNNSKAAADNILARLNQAGKSLSLLKKLIDTTSSSN